jgi:hypothetical protein
MQMTKVIERMFNQKRSFEEMRNYCVLNFGLSDQECSDLVIAVTASNLDKDVEA